MTSNLNGYKVVIVDQMVQKLQVSDSVTITPEFRKEFNEWLANMFGYKPALPNDDVVIFDNTLFVTPEQYNVLKQEFGEI